MTQAVDGESLQALAPRATVDAESLERFLARPRVGGHKNAADHVASACRWKRAMDVSLVLLSVPLWVPIMLVIALAIRLDSPGPTIYRQRRFGRGGRIFTVLKFRTMRIGADQELDTHLAACDQKSAEWKLTAKLREDPRQTRIGRLLRRSSLDELPQLVNVLKGDMSLVGPRPVPVVERERYGPQIAVYARVLPGLTGLWQVSGRNDLPYEKRIELDTKYVHTRSLGGDIKLLGRTVVAVLSRRGAY